MVFPIYSREIIKTMEKPNRIKLRTLMAEHDLSCPDVAEILDRSDSTVREWTSKVGADIPAHSLELLEFKLTQNKDKTWPPEKTTK